MTENNQEPKKTCPEPSRRNRGGQAGNQNARTHGFYSRALTPRERKLMEAASGLFGVDQEISVLRVKILSILAEGAGNEDVLLKAVTALTKLLRVRNLINKDNPDAYAEPFARMLRSVGTPLGWGGVIEKIQEDE